MYAARADSGLEIPPTPFAVTHPELQAVIRESVRRFSQQSLNGERGMDVVLTPPWGTAWLLDVEGFPEDEVEDQVAWELQQRLDAPLEEHIYAWHPQDDQVYAVVIRPEMLEFWDRVFSESDVDLGSITLETGLVDPSIEASADLLPLYRLWADRHPKTSAAAAGRPPGIPFGVGEGRAAGAEGDEALEEELREFDADDDRVRAVEPEFEDEEDSEQALGAIFDKDGSYARKRKRSRGTGTVVLLVLIVAAAVVWQRNRIARHIPGGTAIVQRGERLALRGFHKARSLVNKAREQAIKRTGAPGQQAKPSETPPVAVQQPSVEQQQVPEVTEEQPLAEQPPAEEPQQPLVEEGAGRAPAPSEQPLTEEPQQPARKEAATGTRLPVVTVPLQTVELPPVKPSTGLALSKLYRLADANGVEIESLILQGPGLRFEIGGEEEAVDTWATAAGKIPGGGVARVESPALLAPGVLVEMDLQGVEERSLTLQQFAELAGNLGLRRLEPFLWGTDRAGLAELFSTFEKEHTRPFRLSIHHLRGDSYNLVVVP